MAIQLGFVFTGGIAKFAATFESLLTSIIANPLARVSTLAMESKPKEKMRCCCSKVRQFRNTAKSLSTWPNFAQSRPSILRQTRDCL
jgi:hypothetical protein